MSLIIIIGCSIINNNEFSFFFLQHLKEFLLSYLFTPETDIRVCIYRGCISPLCCFNFFHSRFERATPYYFMPFSMEWGLIIFTFIFTICPLLCISSHVINPVRAFTIFKATHRGQSPKTCLPAVYNFTPEYISPWILKSFIPTKSLLPFLFGRKSFIHRFTIQSRQIPIYIHNRIVIFSLLIYPFLPVGWWSKVRVFIKKSLILCIS